MNNETNSGEGMKSKEEILNQYYHHDHERSVTYDNALKAMEIYASQFNDKGCMRWVKASDVPPRIDTVCRKIGYTDVLDSYDLCVKIERGQEKPNEWEWLDESPSPTDGKGDDKIVIDLEEMRKDKSEGSYYYGWQANIAMTFKDEWERHDKDGYCKKEHLHMIANNAAKNFLDMLLIQPQKQL